MKPFHPIRVARACACVAALALAPVSAPAAPAPATAPAPAGQGTSAPPDLQQVYTNAMGAFNAGDFATAAAGLEKVIAQAPPDALLESVYFTLGAAYFNLAQYPRAVETLGKYRSKYPKGARIAEATFSQGQAALLARDYDTAAGAFKALEGNAAYRGQALLLEGTAYKEAGKLDDAIAALTRLVGTQIRDNATANGALLLADLYGQKKQPDKAVALLGLMRRHLGLLDNIARFNTLATETGDNLLSQGLPKEALACYRVVNTRVETIRLQAARIAAIREDLSRQVALIRADPKNAAQYLPENNRLKGVLADAGARLEEFKKLPDYEAAVLIRIATCYAQMTRKWETVVAYEELLRRYPNDPTREPAMYGLIVASADVGRYTRAHELCDAYLKDFPKGSNADAVGYLTGAMALQQNDPKGAETYFGRMLDTRGQSTYRETMRFLLGNAQFAQGEYDKAQATYAQYLQEFPKGQNAEEAIYRAALCDVFGGNYEKAMGRLNDYVRAYPRGEFVPDARYRLAVCLYAASQYDTVIAACDDWERQYAGNPMLGEVLSLKADSLAAKDQNPQAIDAYLRAYKAATTPEVVDYAIFAAQKLLQKAGDWPRIGEIFEGYVREHPDSPSAVMAVYWIGKARSHEGRTEEAKRFVADTIKKYIADPERESVEQLLSQLATLCVRKKTPAADSAPSPSAALAAASPSPSPSATPPDADPGAELDALLGGVETNASPLARARVLFAKSELARLRRQPAVADQHLDAIATGFQPDDLDAPLLAMAGDHLLATHRTGPAGAFYERLMNAYPKSNYLEFAYNGLAEIAYEAKDYPKALRLYTEAVDKAGATAKIKEVTIGKARTLVAMGNLDEARKLFEQVAGTREWRGESTAEAVYSLGDIMRRQNKLPEAIAYYQRVFVAYGRYLPWVAKAYVASAECFEQLGKKQETLNTYREMVKNPKLQDFAETKAAREYLQKNGQG